ncbi:class II fructose-bisphosphate aldolase [Candidatus Providencia siddallii]|uniref:Fructose-bisphosphate aldolase n=1 Tax=Candidatus Providencia siddallii TaxID=1715285 RepID=A0ABP1CE02_9GAMM
MSKILNFIKPGVVTGYDIQKIFLFAKENNFAIPAINCVNTDSINATLEAASEMRAPVIIQFSNGGSNFIAGQGLKTKDQKSAISGAISGANHIHQMAKHYCIPVIIHTDHCPYELLPWIDGLLSADEKYYAKNGKTLFSSYMIDLSKNNLYQNIEICSKYLMRMSKINMTLEIELGCTGGEEDGINNNIINNSELYTQPKDVLYAYEKLHTISNNFIIAASFGNVHGVYKPGNIKLKPKILFDSQKYISKKFNLPKNSLNFVFHGGSGSSDKEIMEAISYGVIKINIDTDTQWAFWHGTLKYYKQNSEYLQKQLGTTKDLYHPNKKYYDPRVWLRKSQESMISCLKEIFHKFNCKNVL